MIYDERDEPERCGVGINATDDPDFNDACSWHDRAYLHDSWHEHNLTRKQVDDLFLHYMLNKAGRNPFSKFRAYTYYYIARWFGAKYWEGAK